VALNIKSFAACALGAAAMLSSPARAQVTFDNDLIVLFAPGDTATTEGVTISLDPDSDFVISADQPDLVNNGTPNLLASNHASFTIAQEIATPGGFTFSSFELGGSTIDDPSRWASAVTVIGTLLGGGTVSASFAMPGTPTMLQMMLPTSFAGLTSIQFLPSENSAEQGNDYEFVIDNLYISASPVGGAVPEPASWAMMIGGFAIAGGAARRHRKDKRAFA
jgi:hypothetical protein